MTTKKEIKKLAESLYGIIESEAGRKIVDQILLDKYGAQYLSVKKDIYVKK